MSGNEVKNLITEKNLQVSSGEDEPENLELMISRANALMKEDKFEEALDLWEKILEFQFDFVMTCAGYAVTFMAVGKIHASLFVLKKIVKIKSNFINNFIKSICGYANALTKLDRAEEALPFAENAIQLKPKKMKVIISYANVLMKLGKTVELPPCLKKSLKAIIVCAYDFQKLGKVEDSIPLFEIAVRLEPDNIKIIINYANALSKLERVEESLPLFEKALRLKPDNAETLACYANALVKAGKTEESLPWFEQALEPQPRKMKVITSYANALIKLGKVVEPFPFLKTSFHNIISHCNNLINAGKTEESLPLFPIALKLDANNIQAISSYANALMAVDKTE